MLGSIRMKTFKRVLLRAGLTLCVALAYCEFLVYYLVLWQCHWPSPQTSNPLTAMVVADTHLLGSRKGHWWDKLRREWQMHRAFQTAQTYFQPKHIFFLGDLFDEGQWCPPEEFDYYVKRFHSLFHVDKTKARTHVMAGNHDIGFHYVITPYLNTRFNQAFKIKPVNLRVIQGVPIVMINSMAFEGDGCFLCQPAVEAVKRLESRFSSLPPPILMSHFPLYRESDTMCDEPDGAPPHEKDTPFRERWDCISQHSSDFLLKRLKPRLVLSGHTHHGCNTSHGQGLYEISVSSFSWRNRNNPAFLLATFDNKSHRIEKCYLPQESHVINFYIGSLVLFLISFKIF